MEATTKLALANTILDTVKPDLRSHISFVCEEYDDINEVVINLCCYLTSQILDSDSKPLAANIVSKAFKNSYQKTIFPTLRDYASNPSSFKLSLFNELSVLSRYQVSGLSLKTAQSLTWNPRLTSFYDWLHDDIDQQSVSISITNPIDTSTDFRISVGMQIFDCLQFLSEEVANV